MLERLTTRIAVLALALLLIVPLSSRTQVRAQQATPGEWPQLAGGPQRTGYVSAALSDTWQIRWIWNGPAGGGDAGAAPDHLALPKGAQPVVGGGRLYIGHTDGIVRALSEATGAVLWASPVGGQVLDSAAYVPVRQSLFVGTTAGELVRLSAADGQVTGRFAAGSSIVSAPLLVGDTVFIGSTGGTLFAVAAGTMQQRWAYQAGAELRASPAYSAAYDGLVIFPAEDKSVHAVQAASGQRRWRTTVNADRDPLRGNKSFSDSYPVVSEANGVVIIRSYLAWQKLWQPDGGASTNIADTRSFLTSNPTYQSFHVLELGDGRPRFVAPVLAGGIGNNDDLYSTPPQAVVRPLADGSEVAYVFWRNRQTCLISSCDGREDTTLGEMDLRTGNIRFLQDYKSQGTMRYPTDEQGALSMAGDVIFHSHWMLMGALRVTDRSAGYGGSYANGIRTTELKPVSNTLAAGTCSQRVAGSHFCPVGSTPPGEGYQIDPGFYIYYSSQRVYDQFFTAPVRGVVVSGGSIYWKSVDGALIALSAR